MSARTFQTLGTIVATTPNSARIFDRVGLDAAALAEEIDRLDEPAADDWAALAPDALADHIVTTHHLYLREELPLVATLAAKVERLHGARHAELSDVRSLVDALLAALRRATGGYSPPGDGCASYRSLYDRLAALEHDNHVHIHEENHALFPTVVREWDKITGGGAIDDAAPNARSANPRDLTHEEATAR